MARKPRAWAIFFIFLNSSTLFTSAFPAPYVDNNKFMDKVRASIGEVMRAAELTRPRNSWNIPAQVAWRRATLSSLVKDFLKNFEVLGDGLDDGNSVRLMVIDLLKDLEQTPFHELGTGEKWLIMGSKIFTGALKEEIREEQIVQDEMHDKPSARGRRIIREAFFPLTDSASYEDPRMVAVSNYAHYQIDSVSVRGTEISNSVRQRRSLPQVVEAINLGLTNLGGPTGLAILIARTTAYNFMMAYFYSCYQLFSARLSEVVDTSRKRLLSELDCQAAVAAGQGSLAENAGCNMFLKGEQLQSLLTQMEQQSSDQNMTLARQNSVSIANQTSSEEGKNDLQKREQLVNSASKDDEMSFDAKAVADYLKHWTEDPSLRIEVMDLKAIRELYDRSKNYHFFSTKVNLVYKEKLLYYCHFAAEANRRRGVSSTCPISKANTSKN